MTGWWIIPFSVCAAIGAGGIALVAWSFLSEIVRAVRQSHRVATVHVRVSLAERRRPTWREWWFSFRRELFRSYSYLTIGFINIPHNPSEPMRGAYHG